MLVAVAGRTGDNGATMLAGSIPVAFRTTVLT
jgi:hypothetical protein